MLLDEENRAEVGKLLSDRIRLRKKNLALARRIVRKITPNMSMIGINDITTVTCDGTKVNKECYGDAFSCQSNHSCGGTHVYYCGEFSCTKDDFECKGETTYDHGCSDMFECGDHVDGHSHNCEGIHVFRCDDDYYCYEGFTCKAPGEPGGKCEAGAGYSIDGGKDTTSGDFICGYPGGNQDDFDCNSDFTCAAGDDFRCRDSTDFDCGTGDPGDSFTCVSDFQCDGTDFSCNPMSEFECQSTFQCKKNDPFNCPSYQCPACVTFKDEDF